MIRHLSWFERSFPLELPDWMLANIIERLRGTPVRVRRRIETLTPEVQTQREGDAWSIQEHIGHLLDLEPLWTGRVDDFMSGKTMLRAADLTNRKTHEANHNDAVIEDILVDFEANRQVLVERFESFDDKTITHTARHPRLNTPMRIVDHAYFVAEHDDHHLARITEIIHKLL